MYKLFAILFGIIVTGLICPHLALGERTRPLASPIMSGGAGGMAQVFSGLRDDISKGVPGSYSNVQNGPDPTKQKYTTKTAELLPTFYGHGIPLVSQPPGPFDGVPLTSHHFNAKCSPECCPSPYSCDKGCLCVDLEGLKQRK
jgi:hypothetical protein